MSWEDLAPGRSSKDGERKLFLALQDGENLVRVVAGPEVFKTHWVQTAHYPKGIGLKCPGSQICPLCQMGEGTQERAMFTIIARSSVGKIDVRLLDAPKTVGIGLKSLAMNPSWGEISRYDVTISKDSGGNFTRYTCIPNPIVELTPEERGAVAEFMQNVNMKEVASPDDPVQIKEVMEGKEIKRGKQKQAAYVPPQAPPVQYVPQQQYAPAPVPQYQPQPVQPQYQPQPQPVQPQPVQPQYQPVQPVYQSPVQPQSTQPVIPQQPQYQQNQTPINTQQPGVRPVQPYQTNSDVYSQTDREIFGPGPKK